MKMDGSVAVITGGARGIGKALTKALLLNKAKVNFLADLRHGVILMSKCCYNMTNRASD